MFEAAIRNKNVLQLAKDNGQNRYQRPTTKQTVEKKDGFMQTDKGKDWLQSKEKCLLVARVLHSL